MKTLAVIPARGGSKRLVGKNIRPFLGVPLILWSIAFARRVQQFDKLTVSTDCDQIAKLCEIAGIAVPYRRPSVLATDTATSVDVVIDALERAEALGENYDLVALLQPTSPVRDPRRWETAFDMVERHDCPAVIGVSPVRDHPFHVFRQNDDGDLSPWSHERGLALRSQELPAAVSINGSLYLIRTSTLKREKTFFPSATKGVLCDEPWESMDIDTEADWIAAEALASYFKKQP